MTIRSNLLASWFAHLVMVAIGLYMVPFVRDTLEPGAYGVWVFINTLSGYTGLLYLGFGATTCRYVAKHQAEQDTAGLNRTVSTIFGFYSCMASVVLLLAIGLCFAAPWIDRWGSQPVREVQWVILINGLSTAIGMVGSVFGGVLIGSQRVGVKRTIEVSAGVVRFLLAIACLKARPELSTLSLLFLGVTFLENLFTCFAAHWSAPGLQIRRSLISRQTLRECSAFSGYSAIGLVAEQVIYLTDTVVIGFAIGTQHVEPYYIALRITQMIQEPLARIGEVVIPKAGQLHAQGRTQDLGRLVEKMVGLTLLLVAGFFIGSWYFGGMLIRTWIGTGLEKSHRILLILLAAQIVAQPAIIFRKALLGMGDVRVPSLIDIAEAVANLILSLALVFHWGSEGVAWGTFIPLVTIELLVFLPYACQAIGVRKRDLLAHAVLPCLVPLVALWGYSHVVSRQGYPDGWISLIAIAAGGGGVLAAAGLPVLWLMKREVRPVGRTPLPVPHGE